MGRPAGAMDEQESMITSAVFLLKKYVRTKRSQIADALREEEQAVIEPAQSLVNILKEAQQLVDHLEGSVKSLDVSFKMIDKKIRDKLTMAITQQNVLRCRRNREITVVSQTDSLSGNHLIPSNGLLPHNTGRSSSHMSQLSISIAPAVDRIPGIIRNVQSGRSDHLQSAGFDCPFCRSRTYNAKAPLLRHISDSHPDHYRVFAYIYKLTPEAVFSSDEIGGSSQCNYCNFRERSKAPLLRHIQENHSDQYEYFVQIALLKQIKIPPNRPIAKAPTASTQHSQMPCAASSPNHVSSPVKIHNSAMTTTKTVNACNARKSAQAGPEKGYITPSANRCHQTIPSPAGDQPLSRTIQSNQIFPAERGDHAYSCLKRPQPQLQPQNKIKRTRRFQAEQNRSRFSCQYCGEKFSHKNNLKIHVNAYCKIRSPSLFPSAQTAECNGVGFTDVNAKSDSKSDLPITCSASSPSSSTADPISDIRFGDASFITSVAELDVVIDEMRQDEIFQLSKSPRFRRICKDFK